MYNQRDNKDEELKQLKKMEEDYYARKKADESLVEQQQQVAFISGMTRKYGLLSRIWALIASILKLAHQSIGVVAQIIPPLNAMIGGISSILEMVEAIFLSKETLNRRILKTINGFVSTGLSIAALVLAFNPLTAPIGAALSASAIAVTVIKDAIFLYKIERDLRKNKQKLKELKTEVQTQIHHIVYENHKTHIDEIKTINEKIKKLETIAPHSPEINELQHKKNVIVHTIDEEVNTNLKIAAARNQIKTLQNQVNQLTVQRTEKRRSLFNSVLSLVGVTLLAVAAFAVVGAIVANPITLSIVATSILGVATGAAIKNMIFPAKLTESKVIAQKPPVETEVHLPHHEKSEHFSDTFEIVHQMSIKAHRSEKDILESDRADYQKKESVSQKTIKEEPTAIQPQNIVNEEADLHKLSKH